MATDKITDFTKLARREVRLKRRTCRHDWRPSRNGVEVCAGCGDKFPCPGDSCEHLDCIERGHELGRRLGFPRSYSWSFRTYADGHRGGDDCPGCSVAPEDHWEYDVDKDEDPSTWITKIPLEPADLRRLV